MTVAKAGTGQSPLAYNSGMASLSPQPISSAEARRRHAVVLQLARGLGFVGRVEYRHVHSQSGGAQYGRGAAAGSDLLTVYAEAFARDADPDDFSLAGIIAHERGHQVLARHPRLSVLLASASAAAEEVLASLLGALVLEPGPDRDTLLEKAAFELLSRGASVETVERVVANLWEQLGSCYDGPHDSARSPGSTCGSQGKKKGEGIGGAYSQGTGVSGPATRTGGESRYEREAGRTRHCSGRRGPWRFSAPGPTPRPPPPLSWRVGRQKRRYSMEELPRSIVLIKSARQERDQILRAASHVQTAGWISRVSTHPKKTWESDLPGPALRERFLHCHRSSRP